MSSKIIHQFLSNENYVYIVSIFEKFLVNKHSLNEKSLKKLDLRTIFKETMLRIKKDENLKNKSTLDLNKITLSIVKNVIKEKIINPESNANAGTNLKSALQRDMDVNTIPTAPITSNYRPLISKDYIKGEQFDVFTQYENVLKNRTTDKKNTSTLSQASLLHEPENSSKYDENKTDTAMTHEDFMKKLNHMNYIRNNNEILPASNVLPETVTPNVLPTIQKLPEDINTQSKLSITLDQLDQLKQRIQNKTNSSSRSLDEFLSIPKEVYNDSISSENIALTSVNKYKTKECVTRYLLIDSLDRNIKNYENKYEYVIHFQTPIENIVSVKLVQAIYSEVNDIHKPISNEEHIKKAYYVNLMIEEFEEISSNYCNNYTTCRAFTQLPIQNFSQETNSQTKKFKTPIKTLNKISIRILNRDGSQYVDSLIGEHFFKFELKLNEQSNQTGSLNIDDIYDETPSESVDNEEQQPSQMDIEIDKELVEEHLIKTFVETIIDKVVEEVK